MVNETGNSLREINSICTREARYSVVFLAAGIAERCVRLKRIKRQHDVLLRRVAWWIFPGYHLYLQFLPNTVSLVYHILEMKQVDRAQTMVEAITDTIFNHKLFAKHGALRVCQLLRGC